MKECIAHIEQRYSIKMKYTTSNLTGQNVRYFNISGQSPKIEPMKRLIIGPKERVHEAKTRFNCDYVISIQDCSDEPVPTPPGIDPCNHERYMFDDVTDSVPIRYSSRDSHIVRDHPPDIDDVRGILAQFRAIPDGARIYMHCFAGISRSTAMAFMCYCSQTEGGDENGWMMLTERSALSGSIWPNELIVRLADQELGRNGAMIKAVEEWKAAEKAMSWEVSQWSKKLDQKDKDVDQMLENMNQLIVRWGGC